MIQGNSSPPGDATFQDLLRPKMSSTRTWASMVPSALVIPYRRRKRADNPGEAFLCQPKGFLGRRAEFVPFLYPVTKRAGCDAYGQGRPPVASPPEKEAKLVRTTSASR